MRPLLLSGGVELASTLHIDKDTFSQPPPCLAENRHSVNIVELDCKTKLVFKENKPSLEKKILI